MKYPLLCPWPFMGILAGYLTMKILTWNMYAHNPRIDDAAAFLRSTKADVICLQEVPVPRLDILDSLAPHIHLEDERYVYKNKRRSPVHLKLAIASKFPILSSGSVAHKNYYEDVTTKDDSYEQYQLDSHYVDIDTDTRKLRIFNVHFQSVAGPYHRLSQFLEVLANFSKERDNIICGDLNTFGHPFVNLIVWKYLGYGFDEILVNEGALFSTFLHLHRLANPFKRFVTFIKWPIQLDYILVPKSIPILSKRRHGDPFGSDHLPLSVVI